MSLCTHIIISAYLSAGGRPKRNRLDSSSEEDERAVEGEMVDEHTAAAGSRRQRRVSSMEQSTVQPSASLSAEKTAVWLPAGASAEEAVQS